ncbi:hypothetical protein [Magnetococcus marinus]|nr:hypothetical protein [Magnetococcus marinus]
MGTSLLMGGSLIASLIFGLIAVAILGVMLRMLVGGVDDHV